MLVEMDSSRLSGWLEYLKLDDELAIYRMAKAFSQVFAQTSVPPGEEVIDTTKPEFATQFKGFIGGGNDVKYG